MSVVPSLPTHSRLILRSQTSAAPNVSTILGHVPLMLQRSRRLLARIGAGAVLPVTPPLRALASHRVELDHAVRERPAEIETDPAAGDDRPRAIEYLTAGLVLVHAIKDECPGVVARLRDSPYGGPLNRTRERVRRTEVIHRGVLEERSHIAKRGHTDPQDIGISCGKDDLVQERGIETVLEADLRRIGRAREWIRSALQLAQAQSVLGMVEPTVTSPDMLSCVCVSRTAWVVSRVTGL